MWQTPQLPQDVVRILSQRSAVPSWRNAVPLADIVRPGMGVGAGPLIQAMAERVGLVSTIDALVGWDATHCRLSPGERILALIVNLLTDR